MPRGENYNADYALHGGDIAYDLYANHSVTGSMFLNAVEPLAR